MKYKRDCRPTLLLATSLSFIDNESCMILSYYGLKEGDMLKQHNFRQPQEISLVERNQSSLGRSPRVGRFSAFHSFTVKSDANLNEAIIRQPAAALTDIWLKR